ncbi:MAG TPA: hypothetical protein VG755_17465, partial [Nannocystaceae bacterium]|nr:hypothetical protein [Nannocystaceae bacterium]
MPSWSRRCMLALALAVGCGPLVGVGDESSTSTGHVDPSTTRADTGTTSTGTTSTTSAGSTTMTTTTVGTTVDDATASSSDDVTDSGCAFIPEGCQDGGGY